MEQLIAALEREAAEHAAQLLAESRAEAARIREAAESEVARERARLLERDEAAARARAGRRWVEARLEAARSVLGARAELLERVFEVARAGLDSAGRSAAYEEALPGHLAAAVSFFEEEAVVVTCGPHLAETVRKELRDRSDIEVQVDPAAPPGFAVRSRDGRVTVEAGLGERLARRKDALAIEVLARLERAP